MLCFLTEPNWKAGTEKETKTEFSILKPRLCLTFLLLTSVYWQNLYRISANKSAAALRINQMNLFGFHETANFINGNFQKICEFFRRERRYDRLAEFAKPVFPLSAACSNNHNLVRFNAYLGSSFCHFVCVRKSRVIVILKIGTKISDQFLCAQNSLPFDSSVC